MSRHKNVISFVPIRLNHPEDAFRAFQTAQEGKSILLQRNQVSDLDNIRPPSTEEPWIGFWSSGSTGAPKLIWRSFHSFLESVTRNSQFEGWCWATSFDIWSYAGLQVSLQAWVVNGKIVHLKSPAPEAWRILDEVKPSAMSATPTFVDLLLQNEINANSSRWEPRQITLGGEVMRAGLGERLLKRFPETRFTVIYASAEFGTLLKTHRVDGWYEADHLDRSYPDWEIRDQELWLCQQGHWRATGDLAECRDGLIRVLGRCDDVANVGGTKVNLIQIGLVAEQVAGVTRATAYAHASPITGQIVGLRFEVTPGFEVQSVTKALQEHLRRHLPREAVPRVWDCGGIGLGPNSKRSRSV